MYSSFTIFFLLIASTQLSITATGETSSERSVKEHVSRSTLDAGSGEAILEEKQYSAKSFLETQEGHQADAQFEDQIPADDFSGDGVVGGYQLPSWPSDTDTNKSTDLSASGDGPTWQKFRLLPSGIENSICSSQSCEKIEDGGNPVHVTVTVTGGSSKPAEGVNVTLQCDVHLTVNATASISWYLPPQVPFHDDGNITNLEDAEEISQEGSAGRVLRIQKHLTNVNVMDNGVYMCMVLVTSHCCQHNASLTINVHTPHSYGYDVVIVGTVCFLELVVILYVKTRNPEPDRKSNRHKDVSYDIVKCEPENLKQMV